MANKKRAISFGLVHIPVSLNTVIRDNDTSFNQIHTKCMERIMYVKYCPNCKVDVKNSEIVKGYEYSRDNYVTFDKEEFNKLKSEDDRTLEIISFVNYSDIDPIYFEKSYYIKTLEDNKAFGLFFEALKRSKKVAIIRTVMGNKTYYGVLRGSNGVLILTTLYFEEEVGNIEKIKNGKYTDKEISLAVKLIESMSGEFTPSEYKDEYQDRIKDAIDKKIHGKKIRKVKGKREKSVSNLLEALELSLKESKKS